MYLILYAWAGRSKAVQCSWPAALQGRQAEAPVPTSSCMHALLTALPFFLSPDLPGLLRHRTKQSCTFYYHKKTRSSSICLISPSKAPTSCDKWWFTHGQMVTGYTIMPWKQVKTNTWFEREKVEGKQLASTWEEDLSLSMCVLCTPLPSLPGPRSFSFQSSDFKLGRSFGLSFSMPIAHSS